MPCPSTPFCHGPDPPTNPIGKSARRTFDGECGAVASVTIDPPSENQNGVWGEWASVIELNGRSSISVIPAGSFPLQPLGGGGGGGEVTVSVALPICNSLVAVIWAPPAATAVARPDAETVAMATLSELQVIERPVRTLLLASRVTAEYWTVP